MKKTTKVFESPRELLKENYFLTQRNQDLELQNYQLREELLRLEAKLAQAFNQLMVYEEPVERKFR